MNIRTVHSVKSVAMKEICLRESLIEFMEQILKS